MTKLQDFREQYPQYGDLDDETLGTALHERYYSEMDPAQFRDSIGLPPLEAPEKPPSFASRVSSQIKSTAGKVRDPYSILSPGGEDGSLEAFDIPETPTDDPESPLWRDQFFAGWDTYQANRATAGAVSDIEELGRVEAIARGEEDSSRVGGFLGVSGQSISKFARQQRANAGDVRAQFEIDTEIGNNRADLIASLQEQLDRRAVLSERAESVPFSESTQAVVEADTFAEGFSQFADDPITVVAELSIRSAPNMADAAPLAIGGAMLGGPWGFAGGMGVGSSMTEYRASFVDGLLEAGVDINNAESLMSAVENQELMAGVRKYALTRSSIIGGVDVISGGIAGRTLTPFVKPALARELTNMATQTVAQSTLGATGEALAQFATGEELSAGEILAEGLGEGGTVAIDVLGASVTGVRAQRIQNQVARAEAELADILGRDVVTPEPEFTPVAETDADGTAATVPRATPDPPVVYVDARLKRQAFRDQLMMMGDELIVGGGVTYIRDENDVIVGRTPSQNPAWFKDMNADGIGISVKQAQHAVHKAVTGKELGVREARAVGYMLNVQQDQRDAQVDYAKEQLEQARALRREARVAAGLEADPDQDLAGELFEEDEYSADMDATSRVIYELMDEAEAVGVDVERLAIQYDDNAELIGKLTESINDATGTESTQAPGQAQGDRAAPATQTPEDDRRGGQRGRADDRRTDARRREEIENKTPEQLRDLIYSHELTGISNRRAFEQESHLYPFLASIDADSLKFINDNISPDAGDAMLVAVAEALDQAGLDAYHISGDEFYLGAQTRDDLTAALALAESILGAQSVSGTRGRIDGLNITWGIGKSKEIADAALKAEKKSKEKAGTRAPRGAAPPGAVLSVKANKVLDMNPGTNYVPMIGQHGQLPIDPQNNFILGNGRAVRIPKQAVRREHILARMQQAFGVKIFQGRVKGPKTRLGFYRTGQGEIRIRNANDIEVAAHEVAHWLDDRNPWVRKLYEQFDEEIRSVSYDVELDYEGYAEFMRLFFTQEPMAMERAPGFYDAWRSELKKHPKTEAMVYDLQELMHAWTFQGARARLASKHANTEESVIDRMRALWRDSRFLQSALDGLRSVKTAELDVTDGKTAEAYEKLRLAVGGTNGVLEASMFAGTPGWRADGQGIEFTGESLMAVFGNDWGSDDLAMYLIARRAQELKQQGRENLIRDDEIQAGLAIGEEFPHFQEIHQQYQAWNDRMLDFAQGAGILGSETRAAIKEMNQSYVPFHRVIESMVEDKRVKSGGNPFMQLKGGTQNIANVWDNIVNNTGLIIRSSLINDGKRTLYQKLAGATNQKGGLYAAPITTDVKPVGIQSDQVITKIVESMGLTMQQYKMAKQGFGSEAEMALVQMIDVMKDGLGEFVNFFKTGIDPSGDVDFYMENGKKRWMEIADRGLWDSLQFMGPKATNLALNVFGGFSAILRRGTVATPTFQIKNFYRDTTNAWLLSSHIKVPAARALGVVASNMAADPAYQEMMINGGGFANRAQGLQQHRKMIINPKRALAWYDRKMGRFENANRLAEYKASRQAGDSPRRAALNSREISTDFAMRGSSAIARWLAISVPFMNAHVQGLYRLGRQLTVGQLAASYAIRGAMLGLATWALYALNRDDERYDELPEDVKDLNWVFFFGPGEDDIYLFPKPFENGMLFGTVPERILQYTEDEDGKEFADAIKWIALESFALDPTPQLYQPMQDLLTNKTFTGAPILPHYLENVAPSQQYTYYTSVSARQAGEALNMSPVKIEHAIRGYFGTLGTYSLAAADAIIRATAGDLDGTGDKPSRGATWRENIAVRALFDPQFAEGPPRRTKYLTDFYDMVRETEEVANTVALMQKRNNQEVEQYLEDPGNAFLFSLNPAMQQVKTRLSEVRQAMDAIRLDPEMSGDDKMVQLFNLTRQRNELTRQAMVGVRQAEMEAESAQQTAP